MRAVVLKGFGGLEMLEERDLPVPEPGPGEVLVRNLAVAVNPVDAKIRAAGRWAGVEPPFVLGYDAAGVVAKVGPGVRDLKEGDEVYYTPEIFGNPHGTYAEYTPVPAGIVAKKPKNLSFAEAAAIPLAGGTAWEAVVRRLAVRPGETVLVMGGAGGVGSFAVQFAKAAGAYVIATASAENLSVLKELGADLALDYRGPWPEEVLKATEGQGVDAALETAGENLVERVIPVVRPFGRIATILPPQGNLAGLYTKNQTLYGVFLTRERKRLLEMRPLFERGLARPLIAEVLPFSLENLRKAHARMDSGHGRGKIVLTF
ncbi:Zinc-type alcohol dehydrogenase-like protein SA1988 [Thermus thermophilus]|uniref:Zinc-type alcohol dehydrogenase-like protein SA1988 n=1 Tax=Thermus thermophilus TaxID=274 RepID=A0A3P4AP64_THETH|nr:zinc-dependent alcohol dehydrogenase family protein [Thermus thermophilus]VCU52359.1 Zinc-type alcohol dehydrogenase-like protein SA1988 [Thermus thermophilus]